MRCSLALPGPRVLSWPRPAYRRLAFRGLHAQRDRGRLAHTAPFCEWLASGLAMRRGATCHARKGQTLFVRTRPRLLAAFIACKAALRTERICLFGSFRSQEYATFFHMAYSAVQVRQ